MTGQCPDEKMDKKNAPEPTKPFQPECIDLTPEYEGLNIGYVGGVQMPRE